MTDSESGFPPEELAKLGESGRVIAGALGTTVDLWAFAEMGVILKTWAVRTHVSTLAQTDLRTRVRTMRHLDFTGGKNNPDATISISAGLRGPFGRVWLRKKDGKGWRRTHDSNFQPINQHYKKGQWIDLQEAIDLVSRTLQRSVPLARASIGLGVQSIVQIADSLGINLASVPGGGSLSGGKLAYAAKARASNGSAYVNGSGRKETTPFGAFYEAINRYPKALATQMDRTVEGVILGRIKFAEKNLEEGTFLSAKNASRAYPFLEVLRTAA